MPDPRRAALQRIAAALAALRRRSPPSHEQIHAARKDLKRARACLRLLRDAVGKAAYARENAALRDAARPLSEVRDAQAGIQTIAVLLREEDDPKVRARLREARQALREARAQARPGAAVLGEIIGALEASAARIQRLEPQKAKWRAVAAGLERVYRRGRRALRRALADGGDAALHEARKQVKYLEAGLGVLPKSRRPRKALRRAGGIADALGADHDLAVLQARTGLAFAQRRKLQQQALKRAQRLYRRKPAAFVAKL